MKDKRCILIIAMCIIITLVGGITMSCDLGKPNKSNTYEETSVDDQNKEIINILEDIISVDTIAIETFSLEEFDYMINDIAVNHMLHPERMERIGVESNVGVIDNFHTAKEKAREIWEIIYISGLTYYEDDPINVYFDPKNDCWFLFSGPPDTFGSFPSVLIRSNGDIIAIWSDDSTIE